MENRVVSQTLMKLGSRIQSRRLELHLSQESVAEKAEISVNTVSRIEGGQTAMSIEIFMKLIQILNLDANQLLSGIVSHEKEEEWHQELFFRIRHLKQCEQTVVLQTVETLIEGLYQCR